MKVDIIKKFKWYIVGFILVAIMLSVSLSFCTWDNLSAKAKMSTSKSGNYKGYIKLVEDIFLTNGTKGVNGIADVGDIVTFGNYYHTANSNTKTAIRWIVVEKAGIQLTLLAEKVMAFGSFWGTRYYDSSNGAYAGKWGASDTKYHTSYQNYSQSTIRAWLNSNYTLRNDGGTPFSAGGKQQFRGFLSEAFTAEEQAYITDKTISGIKGAGKANVPAQEDYVTVTDKVWIPSWSEVYGTTASGNGTIDFPYGNTIDGNPNARFSYFNTTAYGSANAILNGYTTAYATTIASNYTMDIPRGTDNHQNVSAGGNVWWWLRSPHPRGASNWDSMLLVNNGGVGYYASTYHSNGGIRPAVCVPL